MNLFNYCLGWYIQSVTSNKKNIVRQLTSGPGLQKTGNRQGGCLLGSTTSVLTAHNYQLSLWHTPHSWYPEISDICAYPAEKWTSQLRTVEGNEEKSGHECSGDNACSIWALGILLYGEWWGISTFPTTQVKYGRHISIWSISADSELNRLCRLGLGINSTSTKVQQIDSKTFSNGFSVVSCFHWYSKYRISYVLHGHRHAINGHSESFTKH